MHNYKELNVWKRSIKLSKSINYLKNFLLMKGLD
jgi:hypothetical protein